MNKLILNRRYFAHGGYAQLRKMQSELQTLEYIAGHFSVTKQTIQNWFTALDGYHYDPRADRKRQQRKLQKKYA